MVSKFPKQPNSLTVRLKKIKSNLRDGLGIEVIIERITSGKGNKKHINTTLIKIRKRSPLSPIPPINENNEGNKGESNGDSHIIGDTTSNVDIISPIGEDHNRAQIPSDIDNDGDNGDNLGNYKSDDNTFTTNSFSFNYLDEDLKLRIKEHLENGKTFKCHHDNCLEVEFSSLQEYNKHCHKKHPKQPLHPELPLIEMLELQRRGNPWEIEN